MNTWLYRIMMTMLLANIAIGVYTVYTSTPPITQCLDGIVMEPHEDMWVQKGIWPQHCVPLDKD